VTSTQTITAPESLRILTSKTDTIATETTTPSTWFLVEAAQNGDAEAFGKLYDQYVSAVFRYALFRLGNRALAEDVTSETFLRALRRIGSISYQGKDVGAWFITITRNLIFDHLKSSRHRLEIITGEIVEPATGATKFGMNQPSGPEQMVLRQTTRRELLRCLGELGEDQRECVVLRFIQGLSVTETAAIMKRSEGAVKALQHRAIRKLAQIVPAFCLNPA
jgi:RNA polymerase sigma-70 factor (ECF subfamily)